MNKNRQSRANHKNRKKAVQIKHSKKQALESRSYKEKKAEMIRRHSSPFKGFTQIDSANYITQYMNDPLISLIVLDSLPYEIENPYVNKRLGQGNVIEHDPDEFKDK